MEEEIDLREYVKVVIRWRWPILGLTLAAALVALVMSLVQPATYEATASVRVGKPGQAVDATLPQLATGDGIGQELFAQLQPGAKGVASSGSLRKALKAEAKADKGAIQLTARAQDPQDAARLANAWAELFALRANESYQKASEEEARLLTAKLESAQARLAKAEQALLEYQIQEGSTILEARLSLLQQGLADCLAGQSKNERLSEEISALRARLAGQPAGAAVYPEDALVAFSLQAQAFGIEAVSEPSDMALQSLGQTNGDLGAALERLLATLGEQDQRAAKRQAGLEAELATLQRQVQEVRTEKDRLVLARDAARTTCASLNNQIEAASVTAVSSQIQVSGQAAIPLAAVSTGRLLKVVAGGLLGLMLGLLGAFAVEWWRGGSKVQLEDKAKALYKGM